MVPGNGAEPVSNDETKKAGGSSAVTGCLFGAVALFVFLLIGLLFLAYGQFRANTQPEVDPVAPISIVQPADGGVG